MHCRCTYIAAYQYVYFMLADGIPQHERWSDMSSDELLKCELLEKGSQEYKGVEKKFREATGKPIKGIVSVSVVCRNLQM